MGMVRRRRALILYAVLLLIFIILVGMIVVRSIAPEPAAPVSSQVEDNPAPWASMGDVVPVQASISLSPPSKSLLEGMEPVLASESLQLYLSKATTEVAVLDKRNGQVWRSNPLDRDDDSLASPIVKGKLASQLSLTYMAASNGQTKEYDSYNDSVQYDQFDIAKEDGSILVTYQFGKDVKGIESIPSVMSKERFDEKLLSKLTEEKDKKELQSRYKLSEDGRSYNRRELTGPAIRKMLTILEKVGYTEEDLEVDLQENGQGSNGEGRNAKFNVSIRYWLEGDQFVASVDTRTMKEEGAYRIHSIGLLPYFAAAGKQEEGYMFIPDGSGTLIELNNGKLAAQPVVVPIYGEDGSIAKDDRPFIAEANRMPVFGMKRGDGAFFAIMEEGEALAQVTADISGRKHYYNYIASKFTVLAKDKMQLSSQEELIRMPKTGYQGPLTIRYSFLYEDDADYSGMAAMYRGYVVKKYGLTKVKPQGDAPFYMELIGAIPKVESFLGVPYDSLQSLSDYSRTADLVDELDSSGVRSIQILYSGWFNGGVRHTLPSNVDRNGVLGNREQLASLVERVKRTGGNLYPDVAFMKVYHDKSGFKPSRDASRFLSRKIAKVYEYDPVTFRRHRGLMSHYNLSPSKLDDVVGGFLQDYKKLEFDSISLRDLGSDIHSDYRQTHVVDRQQAETMIEEQVARIKEISPHMMLSGGNAYLLPYADHIVNIPQRSNEFQISDESVPFVEVVLHGYVEYAGKPFNYADDQDLRRNVLRSIETGANVYYRWIGEDLSALQGTVADDLYAIYYGHWLDEAVEAYREVNGVLQQIRGHVITEHEKLANQVYRTTYDHGLSVIINYGKQAVEIGGTSIGASSYVLVRGEGRSE